MGYNGYIKNPTELGWWVLSPNMENNGEIRPQHTESVSRWVISSQGEMLHVEQKVQKKIPITGPWKTLYLPTYMKTIKNQPNVRKLYQSHGSVMGQNTEVYNLIEFNHHFIQTKKLIR